MGSTTISLGDTAGQGGAEEPRALGLVVAWSKDEPRRIGEIAFVGKGETRVYGREGDGPNPLAFVAQRPGRNMPRPAIGGPHVSRRQLKLVGRDGVILVERTGRCPMLVNGEKVDQAALVPLDVLTLKSELVLVCVERPRALPPLVHFDEGLARSFGDADSLHLVGESEAMWELREALAFAGRARAHALVLGESGAGKELAARAIHALSERVRGPFVSRNAATMPAGLVDAELFGNIKNYPNPGTPERVGLLGEAHKGTLFLDEIGELPRELQSHLLRVLDSGGEYHRLGESTARKADVRIVAATNRDASDLKHDLAPRFAVRVEVPPLRERVEDIPLIARARLAESARTSPDVVSRFRGAGGELAIDPAVVEALLARAFPGNVRNVDALLWAAMAASRAGTIALPKDLPAPARPAVLDAVPATPAPALAPRAKPLEAEEIRTAIRGADGNLQRAATTLGLSSRYALYRLLRKFGIDPAEARQDT